MSIPAVVPLTLEVANLFCGKSPTDVSYSLHLKLAGIKLPFFEEHYVDHRPGGCPVALEVDMIFNRLQCTFSILGYDGSVYETIRAWSDDQNWFFFYGLLRDQQTGGFHKVEAQIKGRLGKVEPHEWEHGQLFYTEGEIRGVIGYKLLISGDVVYDWNFEQNRLQIGNVSQSYPGTLTLQTNPAAIELVTPE